MRIRARVRLPVNTLYPRREDPALYLKRGEMHRVHRDWEAALSGYRLCPCYAHYPASKKQTPICQKRNREAKNKEEAVPDAEQESRSQQWEDEGGSVKD